MSGGDIVAAALSTVEAFCAARGGDDEWRIECTRRGRSITIVERRAPWNPAVADEWSSLAVAQLRYAPESGRWSLYSSDSSDRWHQEAGPSEAIGPLLAFIEADPTGIFWG